MRYFCAECNKVINKTPKQHQTLLMNVESLTSMLSNIIKFRVSNDNLNMYLPPASYADTNNFCILGHNAYEHIRTFKWSLL